ncbi:hypothetical protein KA183_01085 [bacterium]|nr:hypothetical protein [bacterium]QQR59116.1 MAG: hypothetical protein IPG59_06395 [Candidatus Melainabacteria bacterium]
METSHRNKIYLELFLLSFASLFFELLVIRWMSADIRAFTVLKSFPLAACYIGVGLGFAQTSDKSFKYAPIFLLLTCAIIKLISFTDIACAPFPSPRVYSWISLPSASQSLDSPEFLSYLGLFLIGVVVLLVGPFFTSLAIGSRLGVLFGELRPITSYSVNLAGATCGTVAFAILSFLSIGPGILFAVPALILAIYLIRKISPSTIVSLVALIACVLTGFWTVDKSDTKTFWSPYERVDFVEMRDKGNLIGWRLLVNRVGQQSLFNKLDPKTLSEDGKREYILSLDNHRIPFLFKPDAKDILTLASGLGNDVTAAVQETNGNIDSVEIDPVTVKLGKQYNDEKPYDSPRVKIYCDDARHFVEQTNKKYDLVRFSFLDSMTVLSQSSTNRLDNYVYTKESIEHALSLLKPGGMCFISFYAKEQWFTDRLYWTIAKAAGYQPLSFTYDLPDGHNVFFVLSDDVKKGIQKMPDNMPKMMPGPLSMIKPPAEPERILTDDWPFLYWQEKGIDIGYLAVTLEIILLSMLVGHKVVLGNSRGKYWQMFFLGSAFLLLELQSIARFSLMFGTTWVTSSIVIASVLFMLLGANLIVAYHSKWLWARISLLYGLLMVTLIGSYLFPFGSLIHSHLPEFLTFGLSTIVTLAPMFMAGLIFGSSLDNSDNSAVSIGFNLLGGVLGALLEYFTSYTGINGIILVSLALYVVSYLCLKADAAMGAKAVK